MHNQNQVLVMPEGPTCKKIQNYIFKFSDLLGQGNFSKVYKAHHQITDQVVAIKIIQLNSLKSKKLEQLLFSEINVLKKLNHPNVLRCFEVFTSNRNCYIITQLCNEGDLQTKLRKRHHFSEEAAEPIIKDVFQGLLYLAQQNIIHRDLKVANVFLHNGRAKIADFGFAKFTNSKFKDINIGSPIYMSPEGFIDNIYGPKTDIWAFGVLIYELLHGQTPFNYCKTQAQLKYNLSIPLSRNKIKPEISTQLQDVIYRCMQIDQEKRITAFELVNLPYFKRLLSLSTNVPNIQYVIKTQNNYTSSPSNYNKMRSPTSYSQNKNFPLNRSTNNQYPILVDQNGMQRRVSFDRSPRQNNFLRVNMSPLERGPSPLNSPLNDFKHEANKLQNRNQNYFSIRNVQMRDKEQSKQQQNQYRRTRQRGITTEKRLTGMQNSQSIKSIDKREAKIHLVSNSHLPKIISDRVTFKQCVNILHYCRLIFKFIMSLKQLQYQNQHVHHLQSLSQHQQNQKNMNNIKILTKWLINILDQISQKVQQRQISYQGGSSSQMRQKKLIQVTSQYQKKYRKQLQQELIQINLKDTIGVLNLDYIKNFTYSLYQGYDSALSREVLKQTLVLAHSIMMIYQATRMIKRCYEQKNYYLLQNYRQMQLFLSRNKESMDMDSYMNSRKKMAIFN